MSDTSWNINNLPNLTGKVIVITGASTGLGKENARVLAATGAHIILAVRSPEKGERAGADIRQAHPSANLSVMCLDLASLESVRNFASQILASYSRLDVLINNAGVMMCPFSTTPEGIEMQLGTNHIGHFALTLLLLPLLRKTPGSRVVVLSSLAHKRGNLDFDDLNWQKRKYDPGLAYSDSKLANSLFALGLVERLKQMDNCPLVTIAHPGVTQTDLVRHSTLGAVITRLTSQSVEQGALPTLRAAFDDAAAPGDFFGPDGLFEMRGQPVLVKHARKALDKVAAETLWHLSEDLSGIKWEDISGGAAC